MAPEPHRSKDESDDAHLKRPLPQVNIPLLREDRRATRMRRVGLLTAGIAFVGVSAAGLSLLPGDAEDEPELAPRAASAADGDEGSAVPGASPTFVPYTPTGASTEQAERDEPEADPEPPTPPPSEDPPEAPPTIASGPGTIRTTFGESRTFRDVLLRLGLDAEAQREVETAVTDILDFRRCRPTDQIVLARSPDGRVREFTYHDQATSFVQARRNRAGELVGRRVERPVETRHIARAGVVQTSLGAALVEAGLGRTLVGAFVEAFRRQVNFNTATRQGDRFWIVVEEERVEGRHHRYGEVLALRYEGVRAGELKAYYFQPGRGRAEFFDATGRSMHGSWLRTPCRYDHMSSPFNPRRMHPILRRVQPHNGVDFAAGTGTPVIAAADGVITWAGPKGANGNLVAIRHANGFQTFYAHLHVIRRGLSTGDRVSQGDNIGQVGTTGRSTGPHLHFGLKRNGAWVDPMAVLNGPGSMMPAGHLPAFRRHMRAMDRLMNDAPRR